VVLESEDLKGVLAGGGPRGLQEQAVIMGNTYLRHSTHFSTRSVPV